LVAGTSYREEHGAAKLRLIEWFIWWGDATSRLNTDDASVPSIAAGRTTDADILHHAMTKVFVVKKFT